MIDPNPSARMDICCCTPWKDYIAPFKVAPHVYYVSGLEWVSVFLIDTGDGLILIDTAMQESLYLLFESIRQVGFDPRDIKLILVSHAHADHCAAARAIAEYSGAKIYLGKEDMFFMTDRRDMLYTGAYRFNDFEPEFYDDNKPITLGNVTVHTKHTPGHTPGTTSFFFTVTDDDGKSYTCGMHGGLGQNTLNNTFFRESGLPTSLRDQFLAGLMELDKMEVDITLPSHSGYTNFLPLVEEITDTHNPFVNRETWHTLMKDNFRIISDLAKEA